MSPASYRLTAVAARGAVPGIVMPVGSYWVPEGPFAPEVTVNPGGGSGWDEPPLDIQIPDDARELERDVLAYHRELRAKRRRSRLRRLALALRRPRHHHAAAGQHPRRLPGGGGDAVGGHVQPGDLSRRADTPADARRPRPRPRRRGHAPRRVPPPASASAPGQPLRPAPRPRSPPDQPSPSRSAARRALGLVDQAEPSAVRPRAQQVPRVNRGRRAPLRFLPSDGSKPRRPLR